MLELRHLYNDLSQYIKERKNGIFCLNFHKFIINGQNLKDNTLFLIENKVWSLLAATATTCCLHTRHVPKNHGMNTYTVVTIQSNVKEEKHLVAFGTAVRTVCGVLWFFGSV